MGLVAVLTRFVPRPGAVFLVVATSVLAGFVGGPLSLDATLATKITLEVMHLIVAVPVVVELMRALERRALVRERHAHRSAEATA